MSKICNSVIILFLCIICFSIIGSGLSSAATVYVDTDGSGNYNCDGTNDHIEINKALTYIDSMGGGIVYLRGPNTYWIDSTLNIGAGTTLTGDSTAEIKLVPNAGWSANVPLIANMDTDDDITIKGFTIDGNSQSQSGISLGNSYYILMYFDGAQNIEVSDMRLEWGCSDGLKIRNSKGITFSDNDVYKMGHDAFYAISCSDMEVSGNTVFTRTNGACRLSTGAQEADIFDNTFYSAFTGDSTGPAIELDKTSATGTNVFDDIEIYNNKIHTLNGAAIWMSASYADNTIHAKGVRIHHNTFTNVGQYKTNTGYSNAAIVLCSFDNTIIENNVFDDGGHAAIKWFSRPGRPVQAVTYTTTVRNNIMMNCDDVSSVTGSGVGIWNTDPTHSKFIVQNNDFYNNDIGQIYGSGFTMANNLNVDPSCIDPANSNVNLRDYHLRSKAGRYSNGKWVADSVSSSLIDAGYSGSAYSSEPSPNNGRINIGRYGNTAQASKSGSTVVNQDDVVPVANAGADKTATAGSSVSFDGSASTDDKGIASYSWDFDASNGINSEVTGKTATKTYTTAGTYTVTLTVTDTAGQKATDTATVVVGGTTTTTPPASTPAEGSVSYSPTCDNGLRASSPTSVFSTLNYIDIGKSSSSCRYVMMFDLSGYKTTDTISKATLLLYWYYPAGATRTSDTVVEVYRPAAEWDPKYVSWNNRASGTPWSTAGGSWYDKNGAAQGSTPYASLTFSAGTAPGNKYYEFDVTELVQEYVSGEYDNTGFFLKAKTESSNYIAFYSSDWSNSAQRPVLTVSTTSGSSQPADNVPVANAGDDQTVTVGSAVSFNGGSSTDDNGISSYSWDFDASNGITSEATGRTATKTYASAGAYTVTLTVTDTSGQRSSDTLTVVVSSTAATTPTTSGSVNLSPLYDNRLRESLPTTVLSQSTYIDIGKSTGACRDVMVFDLSSFKTTDTLSKATLSLYWYYPSGTTRTSDTVIEIYRPLKWDPNSVTWISQMSGTPWATAGGNWFDKNGVAQGSTPYATLTFPASTVPGNKYYEFDVTSLMQEYISGKYENTGFFLKAKTEAGNYIAFYSNEWSNSAQRPKLTIASSAVSNQVDSAPVANAGSDKTATVSSVVSFDAGASTDDKGIVSYTWDFDASNGVTSEATGRTATKAYTTAGDYTVTLIVMDTSGQKSTDTLQVSVSDVTSADKPPVANAGADKTVSVGSAVSFSGSLSTDDVGIVSYRWDFDASNGVTTEATGMKATKTYTKAGTYTVTLIVIDSKGQKDMDTLTVSVK